MSNDFPNSTHIRHCLLYEFHFGTNASEAARKIKKVYGEKGLSVSQCQRWYNRFRSGNFSLEDLPRLGQPIRLNNEDLKALVETDPKQLCTRTLGTNWKEMESRQMGPKRIDSKSKRFSRKRLQYIANSI
jgi:transposase